MSEIDWVLMYWLMALYRLYIMLLLALSYLGRDHQTSLSEDFPMAFLTCQD